MGGGVPLSSPRQRKRPPPRPSRGRLPKDVPPTPPPPLGGRSSSVSISSRLSTAETLTHIVEVCPTYCCWLLLVVTKVMDGLRSPGGQHARGPGDGGGGGGSNNANNKHQRATQHNAKETGLRILQTSKVVPCAKQNNI